MAAAKIAFFMRNSTLDANLGPFFTGLGSSVTEMGLFTNSIASKSKGRGQEKILMKEILSSKKLEVTRGRNFYAQFNS